MTLDTPLTSVVDILRAQAQKGTAHIVDYRRRVSADELDRASNRAARALATAGVRSGDRVALLEHNSIEFLELLFACAKLGAMLVPLNTRLTPNELADILRSCTPRLLIVHPELWTVGGQAAKAGGIDSEKVWCLESGPEVEITADSYTARCAAQPDTPAESETISDIVCLTYTSGTTGGPKGVMIRHDAFVTFLPAAARSWGLDETSVGLVVLPMFHIGGIAWFFSGFIMGADTVMLRRVDPELVLDTVEKYRVTHTNLVATILRAMLLGQERRPRDVASFKTITCGGAPIPGAYLRQAQEVFGGRFIAFYGLSEAGGGVTHQVLEPSYINGDLAHRLLSAGKPLPGVEIEIRDPNSGETVAPGAEGEIVVRTPGVMAGYWDRPEETAAAMTADGWLRTGDMGRIDDDGYLYIVGRLKEIIISGGENIHPAEVEDVIATMPGVAEACVVGVPHEVWGETVVAVVVETGEGGLTPEAVIAYCRERLAHYKCPTAAYIVPQLPRTASGKVERAAVQKEVLAARGGQETRGVSS